MTFKTLNHKQIIIISFSLMNSLRLQQDNWIVYYCLLELYNVSHIEQAKCKLLANFQKQAVTKQESFLQEKFSLGSEWITQT